MKIIILICATALLGCEKTIEVRQSQNGVIVISRGAIDHHVVEIELSDGTKCAALVGGTSRAAISCGWKQ